MPGKKTSVYLSDEIVGDLQELGLNAVQACRLGIAAEKARREAQQPSTPEMQLLSAVARNIVRIRDAVVCDCLGDRKGHLAGSTPACSSGTSDASLRRQAGAQLAGNSLGADSTKRPNAKQEMLAHQPPAQQTPHQRGLLTGTMTPEDTAGISEPVEYFYAEADPNGVHTAHCCKIHGCKYSPDNNLCPVFTGSAIQLYPCEWCADDEQQRRELAQS